MLRVRGLSGLLLVGAGALGCGGGGGGSGNNPAITIAKGAPPNGDAQIAVVATELPESLRVVVKEDAAAKAGVTVTWSTSAAGATMDPTSSVTDPNGFAATSWTLGQTAGLQAARATLAGAGGSLVSFTATANPGPAAALTIQAGNNQQPLATTPLAGLTVKVTDGFGNGVTGQAVAWSVLSVP
jgi:hypothetical protein